ncbi:MAG: LamG-like jellyroll fold domain-containing protein [Candidatus Omnitrophota bacterium]
MNLPKPIMFLDFEKAEKELARTGKEGQGQWLGENRNLVVSLPAGIPEQGTITFWFQPSWRGNDNEEYYLLESSVSSQPNSFALRKLVENNKRSKLQFVVWDSAAEPKYCESYRVESWEPGAWYHVAVAWLTNSGMEEDSLIVMVNGEPWAGLKRVNISWQPGNEVHIGYWATAEARNGRGIIDNFALYDTSLAVEEIESFYGSQNTAAAGIVPEPPKIKPAEPEQALVPRLSIIPVLPEVYVSPAKTGDVSKIDWEQSTKLSEFLSIYTGAEEAAAAKTYAWMVYDEENLYIRVKCADPDTKKIETMGSKRDDPIWNGDVVEVFIQPPEEKEPITHLIVNPKNIQWDSKIDRTQSMEITAWNGGWQSWVSASANSWEVILKIPWSDLTKLSPVPHKGWRFNIGRNSPRFGPTAWACTMGIFNRPQWFGVMELNNTPPPVKLVFLKIEEVSKDELSATAKLCNHSDSSLQLVLVGESSGTAKKDSKKINLAAGEEGNYTLSIPSAPGEQIVSLSVLSLSSDEAVEVKRNFFVKVPQQLSVRLDQFAYWTIEKNLVLNIDSLLPGSKLPVTLNICIKRREALDPVLKEMKTMETGTAAFPVNISGFLPGRYTLIATITDSDISSSAEAEFLVVPKLPPEEAVPIQKTEVRGKDGLILLNGKPHFPIFMSWLDPGSEEARALGITSAAAFVPGDDPSILKDQLDAAMRSGGSCHLVLDHDYFYESFKYGQVKPRLDRIEQVVKEYRNHPALFAWFLFDEPNNLTSTGDFICEPKELEAVYNLVKKLDPNHLVTLVCAAGRDFKEYKNAVDVMQTDVYPIPDCPITQLPEAIKKARQETGKPVWSFVQSSWMRPGQRPVLPHELLNQAHLSLVYNVVGLSFFNWDGERNDLYTPWRQKGYFHYLRSTFKIIDFQLHELLKPLFEGQPEKISVGGLKNPEDIQARGIRCGNNLYIIVSNVTSEAKTILLEWNSGEKFIYAEVVGEGWKLSLQDKALKDNLGPMESRIYKLKT